MWQNAVRKRDGRLARKRDGRLARKRDGRLARKRDGRLARKRDGRLARKRDGRLVRKRDGRLVAYTRGWDEAYGVASPRKLVSSPRRLASSLPRRGTRCPWRIFALPEARDHLFALPALVPTHSCSPHLQEHASVLRRASRRACQQPARACMCAPTSVRVLVRVRACACA